MSEFMPAPSLILATMEDVKTAIETPDWRKTVEKSDGRYGYLIKSVWLIALINEIAASEYPYNATVKKLAEQRLGYAPKQEAEYSKEGDALSLLIYNAQRFRSSDQLVAAGYKPLTQAMIDEAGEGGMIATFRSFPIKIVIDGKEQPKENDLLHTVKKFDGKLYAMFPRSQKKFAPPNGHPAKIVPAKSKRKAKATEA